MNRDNKGRGMTQTEPVDIDASELTLHKANIQFLFSDVPSLYFCKAFTHNMSSLRNIFTSTIGCNEISGKHRRSVFLSRISNFFHESVFLGQNRFFQVKLFLRNEITFSKSEIKSK